MKLTPVDYNPFEQETKPSRSASEVKLTPVDYDPFADTVTPEAIKNPGQELAGVMQPVNDIINDLPHEVPPESGWGETLKKTVENVPQRFTRSLGGFLSAMGEGDSPLNQLMAPMFNIKPENRTDFGEQTGQAIWRDATNKIQDNAPVLEQGSAKYYASNILGAMAEMGPALATTFYTRNPHVGMGVMTGQVFTDKFSESLEKGRDRSEATMDGLFYAATEGLTEKIPLGILTKEGGKWLARTLKAAGAEGIQETVTEGLQIAYERGVLNEHEDMTTGDALRRMWDAGIIGAGAGGGLAVVTSPVHALYDPQRQLGKELDKTINKTTLPNSTPVQDPSHTLTQDGYKLIPVEGNPFETKMEEVIEKSSSEAIKKPNLDENSKVYTQNTGISTPIHPQYAQSEYVQQDVTLSPGKFVQYVKESKKVEKQHEQEELKLNDNVVPTSSKLVDKESISDIEKFRDIDTRGKGDYYHGTSTPITEFDEGHYASLNYYGNGFYTTDAVDVAMGYTRKGKGKSPVVYRVNEKKAVKLLDLEKPLPPQLADYVRKYVDFWPDNTDPEKMSGREVLDEIRDSSYSEQIPADDVQGVFESMQYNAGKLGYGGWQHKGGVRTNKSPHTVKIYFNPRDDVDIEQVTSNQLHNKSTEKNKNNTDQFISAKVEELSTKREAEENIKKVEQGNVNFSKAEPNVDETVASQWQELAKAEEMYQQPKSVAKVLGDIVHEVDPGISVEKLDKPAHAYPDTTQEWKLTMPDGKTAYMRENNNGTLELNAALLESGKSRGNALYNIVSTYAYNNGKVFIGDREGLSEDANYRRTENMLSSALKFGTTKHLRPHPEQKIEWIQGDDKGNLVRLIQRHYANITEQVPLIEDIYYDFSKGYFLSKASDGRGADRRVTESHFRQLRNSTGARKARAGDATLKRAIITNTLVQGSSPETRSRLLGQIIRQLRTGVDTNLKNILYSKETASNTSPANAGLSVSEVEKIIAPVILKWGDTAPSVEVVQSVNDVPEFIVDASEHPSGFEAVYYSPQGQIYLVAEKLQTEDRVLKVLAHEAVGHHSFEELVGNDMDTIIERVQWLKKGEDKKITDIAREVERRFTVRDKETGRVIKKLDKEQEAKEIIAVMAERGIKHPLLATVVAAIKRFLRKLRVSLKWTATELEALVVQAGKRLDQHGNTKKTSAKVKPAFNHNSKMFSRPEPQIMEDIEQAATNTPTITDRLKEVKAKFEDSRLSWFALLTRLHLADIGKDVLPQIETYIKRAQQMDADRNHMIIEAADIAKPWATWARKNKKEANQLAMLMHEATKEGVDPAKAYIPLITEEAFREQLKTLRQHARNTSGQADKYIRQIKELNVRKGLEKNREKAYPILKQKWDRLSSKAKHIYRKTRDMHEQRFEQTQDALLARIDRAELSQNEKQKMKDEIRLRFESMRVQAPYFPLFRAGDYWVSIKKPGNWQQEYTIRKLGDEWGVFKKSGRFPRATFGHRETAVKYAQEQVMETEFYMFEGSYQQKNFAVQKQKEGWQVTKGKKIDNVKSLHGASAGFVKEVIGILDNVPGSQSDMVKDAVYQLYLTTLPELSSRKHFIHRQKTGGHSEDALRAFAHNTFHGAYQLAKLQHSDILESYLENMQDNLSSSKDSNKAADVLSELQRRHEWAMNPQGHPAANIATQLAFVWYLGLTPSAAMVNTSQTALVALPVMGAEFGWSNASMALLKAGRDFFGGRTSLKEGVFSAVKAKGLSLDELRAFNQWLAEGVIDKTLAHDLASQSEKPSEIYSGHWTKAMEVISYGFHHAERFNREVTALAAYRLARQKGAGHEKAVDEARRIVYESHFDYSSANKARFMQNDTAKVILIFRQYSLNMTYLLARNLQQSSQGASKEVRREAQKKLAGILGMHTITVGIYGLPAIWLVATVMEAVFDDEDEPWDFYVEFRNFLSDIWGDKTAEAITVGSVQAYTDVGLHNRQSLNELWLRSPNRDLEAQKSIEYWMLQLGFGPLGSIITNAGRGMDLMNKGEIYRGIEAMTPKAIRDGLKAMRYADEGVQNLRGDPVVNELNEWEIFLQTIGFTPGRVAKQYDVNTAIKNYETRLKDRRRRLINLAAISLKVGDTEEYKTNVLPAILAFNKKNPRNKIDMQSIRRSVKTRQRYSKESMDGINLQKSMRHLRERIRYGDDE